MRNRSHPDNRHNRHYLPPHLGGMWERWSIGVRWLVAVLCLPIAATYAMAQPPGPQNRDDRDYQNNRQQASSGGVAVEPRLAATLLSPFQSTSSGTPARSLVQSVATVGQFNLWFDRQLDSAAAISLAPGPQSVFQTLSQLADSCGAEVAAVDNVVLFGQPERVRRLAAAIWQATASDSPRPGQDFAWPAGTTPSEAWQAAGLAALPPLPHDHWPATEWRQLSPDVAALLIAAQFDRFPGQNRWLPGQTPAELRLTYPPAVDSAALLRAAQEQDRRAYLTRDGRLSSTVSGQLAATAAWLGASGSAHAGGSAQTGGSPPGVAQPATDPDRVLFTMTLQSTRVQTALQQIATTAGRRLTVTPQAAEASARLIDLQVEDRSLRQIAASIAELAGLSVQWSADQLHVDLLP